MKRHFINAPLTHSLAMLAFALTAGGAAAADSFPTKPVRIVVNTGPGGLTDVAARLVAQKMSEKLGQSVIVENRGGADGLVGTRYVKTAPADGYTILATAGSVAIQPAVKLEPGYDLVKDFTGVGPMVRSPLLMVVAAGQPDKNLNEFIARAKANPNKVSYASAGVGTTTHVPAAMLMRQSGLQMLHVPYKGNGAALPDVLAGRVGMIFDAYGSCGSYLKAGSLRALGVTSATRLAALPDVPTFKEQGIDYTYSLWLGLLAPAGTPKAAIQRLSEALHYATSSKDLVDRFHSEGSEPMFMPPEEFNAFLKNEVTQVAKLMADLNIPKQ